MRGALLDIPGAAMPFITFSRRPQPLQSALFSLPIGEHTVNSLVSTSLFSKNSCTTIVFSVFEVATATSCSCGDLTYLARELGAIVASKP